MTDKTHFNTREAAKYVALGVSTLEKLRLNGGGPAYSRPVRRVIYRRADLDAFVAAHLRQSTSANAA